MQVTVQFTRNNMTASMFDLTMKDKPRSVFGKLKDRVTGRKIGDMESSSAIVPGRFAALSGSLGKPFREGDRGEGGEGPVEVAEEKRSKVKDFFLGKGKLRRSSDTRSCSSLASESSVSSTTSESHCPPSLGLGLLVDPPSSPIYSSKVKVDTHHGDTDLAKKGKPADFLCVLDKRFALFLSKVFIFFRSCPKCLICTVIHELYLDDMLTECLPDMEKAFTISQGYGMLMHFN